MDYKKTTIWTVIKRFLSGWAIAVGILVIISCIKYGDFIIKAFTNNAWAWLNAVIPAIIIIFGVIYILRSIFK